MVLVKNTNGLLPLNADSYKTAVTIGPNADLTNTVGYYGSQPCPNQMATPQEALSQHIAGATTVKGVPSVGSTDESGIPAAAAAAAAADLVFLTIGSNLDLEAEGHDRLVIDFSAAQVLGASTLWSLLVPFRYSVFTPRNSVLTPRNSVLTHS